MRRPETRAWRDAERAIASVLMKDWDPIGVADVPEAQDEYDGYVSIFVALLSKGAPDEELVRALHVIETDTMGLSPSPVEARERLARKIRTAFAATG